MEKIVFRRKTSSFIKRKIPSSVFKTIELFVLPHYGNTKEQKKASRDASRHTQENARNVKSQNSFLPDITEEYITQVSQEIEKKVIEILSLEFSRMESRIFGTSSELNEYFLNPQVRTCSDTLPGSSGNNNSKNREPTGDCSSYDSHPEVKIFVRQASISGTQTGKRPLTW